ncbi:MAG: MBL fold metallo-hydrolase [Anaerolineae bacterium]|nr:MBL fold metallo-hydrolase [Anaerolineae bacterium]
MSAEDQGRQLELTAPYVTPLGVSAALADMDHANTFLAVVRGGSYWLIDCADNPVGRLQRAGIDPLAVRGVILTHFHPDHVYGLPSYLVGLYLTGLQSGRPRHIPLAIYARPEVLNLAQIMVGLFQLQEWTRMFSIDYRPITMDVGAPVAEDDDLAIFSAPTHHSVPSIALRFVAPDTGRSFVYSSDTSPCPEVQTLAWGAALLFHEASGAGYGHTSAAEAAALGSRASVARLVLIHYDTSNTHGLLKSARAHFDGPVELAREFERYSW